MFCYSRNHFKKHEQVYEIVTCKICVTLNFPRKGKILLFFTVVDWGTLGRVITQTRGQTFNHFDKFFKHLTELLKFSVKLLVFF